MNTKEGKIAKIIDSTHVAINLGENSGVKEGDIYEVFNKNLCNITDPDTGKDLGSINTPIVTVQIVRVEEKFSIAATYSPIVSIYDKINKANYENSLSTLTFMMMNMHSAIKREQPTLRATDGKRGDSLNEKDSKVKVGDIVRFVSSKQEQLKPIKESSNNGIGS